MHKIDNGIIYSCVKKDVPIVLTGSIRDDHQAVGVAVFHQRLHGRPGVRVKSEGRAHDPQDVPVLLLVAQKLEELIVVPGKGSISKSTANGR